MFKQLVTFILIFLSIAKCQASVLDSLHNLNPTNDTHLIKTKISLADAYRIKGELKTAEVYAVDALELAQKIDWSFGIAKAYNELSYIKIYESNYEESMKYAIQALKIGEHNNDLHNLAYSFLYIGYINTTLQEFDTAKVYYLKSLKIRQKYGTPYELGFSLTYLANLYREINLLDSALLFHKKALLHRKKANDKRSIADSYLLIGGTLYKQGKYKKALEYCINALSKYLELEDKKRLGETYRQLAEIKIQLTKYREAELYLLESLKLARESASLDNIILIFKELSTLNEGSKNYYQALQYLKKHYALKDSISSEQVYREASKLMLKYKVNKEKRIAELVRENERFEQKIINYTSFGGIFILIVFIGFVIHRLRITKRQNLEIEKKNSEIQSQNIEIQLQNEELETTHDQLQVQHKEINDSIAYAKRIQAAILPPISSFNQYLNESFVLYKPKDVVAGDFYWIYHESKSNTTFFAAADCTGHGVPGALVSVVCINALNRCMKEFKIEKVDEILEKTRELVTEEFGKSEEDVQDGMDIALCAIRENNLHYSGANNPMWLIRKGDTKEEDLPQNRKILKSEVGDYSLIEIKAHKEPIGKYYFHSPFVSHSFTLKKDDTLYLFSDGFSDQFGGENGKKLKSLNFKSILLSVQDMNMNEQHHYLTQAFEKWKGEHEQVDDVCVVGVRF